MAGLFKANDVSEQRRRHCPRARAASRGTALRRSRDICKSFGAVLLRPAKHLTRRRRLAVAAEVRARVHPWLWSAPHPTHTPSRRRRDSQVTSHARPTTAAATGNGSKPLRANL
jgi:hypothetical protein